MSRLSTNERQVCDTGGNVRASYLSFRLAPTDDITSDLDPSFKVCCHEDRILSPCSDFKEEGYR